MNHKKWKALITATAMTLIVTSIAYFNINEAREAKHKERDKMLEAVIKYSDLRAEYARKMNEESVGWMINLRSSEILDKK